MSIVKQVLVRCVMASLAGSASVAGMTIGQNLLWCYHFREGVNFATTENPWIPAVIEELKPFTILRYMDAVMINRNWVTRWQDRVRKTDADQSPDWVDGDQGMAWEWVIDLSNRVNRDPWICIPLKTVSRSHLTAIPDYALRLAILMKTGVDTRTVSLSSRMDQLSAMSPQDFVAMGGVKTCEPLSSNLNIYIEYANETWLFTWDYVDGEGVAIGAGGPEFHAMAAIRCAEAFYTVFGKDNPRIRLILAGQAGNAYHSSVHLACMKNAKYNPSGIKAYGIAIAPYMGPGDAAQLREDYREWGKNTCTAHKALAAANGVKLMCYEGGQHCLDNSADFNRSAEMYTLYNEYLTMLNGIVDGCFVHYGYAGAWFGNGSWGSKEYPGQPDSQTPKYRALAEWARKLNPPPVAVRQAGAPIAEGRPPFSIAGRTGSPGRWFALSGSLVCGDCPVPATGMPTGDLRPTDNAASAAYLPAAIRRLFVSGMYPGK